MFKKNLKGELILIKGKDHYTKKITRNKPPPPTTHKTKGIKRTILKINDNLGKISATQMTKGQFS